MNHGRHGHGRRRGRGRGYRMRGFLQPCLLLLLFREDTHGYGLLNELQDFGPDLHALDPSMIYRVLRDMEEAGWITSYEGKESLGPRRRMYRLTGDGKDYLNVLIEEARRTKKEITLLLEAYEKEVDQ